ncbi:MAG: hypothetical protein AAF960_07090 [Bacteroidota bacterium]
MSKSANVSSNWTLFLKVFFPVLWGTFFGLVTFAFWMTDLPMVGSMPINSFRLMISSFLFTGLAVLYFSFIQLKRVEVDSHFLYVTNYKKTARYPFHNIKKIEEANYFLFKIVRVFFREPGMFGKKIIFMAHDFRLNEELKKRKELAAIFEEARALGN